LCLTDTQSSGSFGGSALAAKERSPTPTIDHALEVSGQKYRSVLTLIEQDEDGDDVDSMSVDGTNAVVDLSPRDANAVTVMNNRCFCFLICACVF
jgi:hypothetical protein